MKRFLLPLIAAASLSAPALACPIEEGFLAQGVLRYPSDTSPVCNDDFYAIERAISENMPVAENVEMVALPEDWDGGDIYTFFDSQLRAAGFREVKSSRTDGYEIIALTYANNQTRRVIMLFVINGKASDYVATATSW